MSFIQIGAVRKTNLVKDGAGVEKQIFNLNVGVDTVKFFDPSQKRLDAAKPKKIVEVSPGSEIVLPAASPSFFASIPIVPVVGGLGLLGALAVMFGRKKKRS